MDANRTGWFQIQRGEGECSVVGVVCMVWGTWGSAGWVDCRGSVDADSLEYAC